MTQPPVGIPAGFIIVAVRDEPPPGYEKCVYMGSNEAYSYNWVTSQKLAHVFDQAELDHITTSIASGAAERLIDWALPNGYGKIVVCRLSFIAERVIDLTSQ